MASVLDIIKHYQQAIEKHPDDEQRVLRSISKLQQLGVTVDHLKETGVGRTVNALRKEPGDVGHAARALVNKWKYMVASESDSMEQEENNHESTNVNGDGYRVSDVSGKQKDQDRNNDHDRSHSSSRYINGDHNNSKRRQQSSAEDEPYEKKAKHQHTSDSDDNEHKTDVKIKTEPQDSDSERSESDSDDSESDSSQECEIKKEIKQEPIEQYELEKHSSKENSIQSYENENKRSSDSSKHREISSRHDQSSSRHKESHKHSSKDRERETSSEKRHKSHHREQDAEKSSSKRHSSDKEKSSSSHKNSSSSEKHRSSEKYEETTDKHKSSNSHDKSYHSSTAQLSERQKSSHKHDDNHQNSCSEKHRSSNKHEDTSHKHKSDNPDKHRSSSKAHKSDKSDTDTHKSSSERHKSKDGNVKSSHSGSSDRNKVKDKSSSSKEKSSHNDRKHSSSSDSKTKGSDSKHKLNKAGDSSSGNETKNKSSSSSKHRESSSKTKETIPKSKKSQSEDSDDGIGCESGASFAQALGMVSPVKSKKKIKTSSIKDVTSPASSSSEFGTASLLAPSTKLAPLPALEISALPEISPNYKPRPPPKLLPHFSDEDALSAGISSKNQRTKVYSGNKMYGKLPTLYEMCVQVLQQHIDALEFTGGVPYDILKPVVDKATPQQLFVLEHFNPYLMEDTDHLWQAFCIKHFRGQKREEMETWREMYIRCQEEQEIRLKSLTQTIKIAQEAKKAPVKQTKMAYVDSVVKPPRNIARKQAIHGTARLAAASPAARVASLSSTPLAVRAGTIRPPPAPAASTSSLNKPKKAPLMQKALQFMRGRKR